MTQAPRQSSQSDSHNLNSKMAMKLALVGASLRCAELVGADWLVLHYVVLHWLVLIGWCLAALCCTGRC